MNDLLNLHQLQLFCAVVDYGSYVEAAKHLVMTQPALSLQIKSLQTSLDTTLFERCGNRLYLTESGKATYEYAKNILLLEHKLKDVIQELNEGDQGNVAIGSSRSFGRYTLLNIIGGFVEKNPKVNVSIIHKGTEVIYNQLTNKILDIGIVTSDETTPLPPDLQATKFHYDHWCLVCGSKTQWAVHKSIDKLLFQSAPLISALEHSTHWSLIEKMLFNLNIHTDDYTIRLRMEDLESIKISVLKGLGIAFLPFTFVQNELENGDLVEFTFPDQTHPPLDCLIVTQKNTQLRPVVQRFITFLQMAFPLGSTIK